MRQNARRVLIAAPLLLLLTGCDEKIVNAGYNTLLGMGMAFTVLIIISLVISVLSILSKAPDAKKKNEALRSKAVDNAVKQIEKQEQAAAKAPAVPAAGTAAQDGGFMIAIFAAAIAAYEAESGTGSSPVITGVTPLGSAARSAQPLPDLTGYEGVYVRPLRKQNAVHWKRA